MVIIFFFIILFFLILYFKFKNYVPILMYHRIADISGDRNALSEQKFTEQINYLSENGFKSITLDMLYSFYRHGTKLPNKPILITFDDGYEDNLSIALPILKKYNMCATVFAISNWIGKANQWENFNKALTHTMTASQLHTWKNAGMEIASHTVNHPFLSKCSTEQLEFELDESKKFFKKTFNQNFDFICYPYGDFNEKTIIAVQKANYKAAFAIFDKVPLWKINLFALPRIPIPSHQSLWEFKLKVSNIHIIFIALRKWERILKKLFRKS